MNYFRLWWDTRRVWCYLTSCGKLEWRWFPWPALSTSHCVDRILSASVNRKLGPRLHINYIAAATLGHHSFDSFLKCPRKKQADCVQYSGISYWYIQFAVSAILNYLLPAGRTSFRNGTGSSHGSGTRAWSSILIANQDLLYRYRWMFDTKTTLFHLFKSSLVPSVSSSHERGHCYLWAFF